MREKASEKELRRARHARLMPKQLMSKRGVAVDGTYERAGGGSGGGRCYSHARLTVMKPRASTKNSPSLLASMLAIVFLKT